MLLALNIYTVWKFFPLGWSHDYTTVRITYTVPLKPLTYLIETISVVGWVMRMVLIRNSFFRHCFLCHGISTKLGALHCSWSMEMQDKVRTPSLREMVLPLRVFQTQKVNLDQLYQTDSYPMPTFTSSVVCSAFHLREFDVIIYSYSVETASLCSTWRTKLIPDGTLLKLTNQTVPFVKYKLACVWLG